MEINPFENITRTCIRHLTCLLLLLFTLNSASGQTSVQTGIDSLVGSLKIYNERLAIEKLYVQTDKPEYFSTDTIWFKAYLLDAARLSSAPKSGLLYVEIASDDSSTVVKRMMLPVVSGLTWGNIALNTEDFPGGTYTFRAYTSWMRNSGEDYVFMKQFLISDPEQNSWLLNSDLKLLRTGDKDQASLTLHFRDFDKKDIGLRPMRLRVTDGRRVLLREEMETTLHGELQLSFNLPPKSQAANLYLTTEDLRKGEGNRKLTVPLPLNRPERTDLQFMPEGGSLVAGLWSDVAFKAIAEDGRGAGITGKILDSKLQEITTFTSSHKGMGIFRLLPQAGESYLARIALRDGSFIDYPLPTVKSSGTVLKVNNRLNAESIEVIIQASADLTGTSAYYHLVGQTNGLVHYGAAVLLKQPLTRILVDKNLFSSGVARLTLLDKLRNPLNERRIFIKHPDEELDISFSTDTSSYIARDSISMEVSVRNYAGQPVRGSFSVAVTDDARVRTDTNSINILNTIYLSSALKGMIEEPDYYFRSADTLKAWQDLDQLLLTQGWVNYSWPDAFAESNDPVFPAETEFSIKGTVRNIFNKPVANTSLVLFSKQPLLLIDTLTNDKGRFTFRDLPPADTAVYVIQTRNKRGKSFNVGIEVDEFVPPVFHASRLRFSPWFLNSDTILLNSTRSIMEEQRRYDAPAGVNVLEEVVVTAKKIIKESHNRNGSGNADYILDEQEMLEAKKKSLFELLGDRFPDFRKGLGPAVRDTASDTMRYVLMNRFVHLVIDGVNVRGIGSTEEVYMDYLTAEDITGIEIMKNPKYAWAYDPGITGKIANCPSRKCPPPPIFLEVTTRWGNGAFMRKTPGVYLYKPLAYSFPSEFYRPRYPVKEEKPALADLRSTIHWEPNIITDEDGKARISFYSADQNPSTYTVIIEGADLNGKVGYERGKIRIELPGQKTESEKPKVRE